MKHRSTFIVLAFCIFSYSCKESENKNLIIGHWTGTEWLVEGHPSTHTPEEAIFTFDTTGNYSFEYAGNIEKGAYYVNNNQLFTTPEGGIKMMVKIPMLTQDTLIFDMNRGGQAERLTLVRK